MLEYQIVKGKVTVDAKSIQIKELFDIWDAHTTDKATAYLTWIHLTARIDPEAPFYSADEQEIEELVTSQVFKKAPADKVFDQLRSARKAYLTAYEKPEVRMVNIYNDKIDALRKLIQSTEPQIEKYITNSGSIGFASNTKALTDLMEGVDKLVDTRDRLEAKIRKDTQDKTIRGGKKLSLLEQKKVN